MNAAQLKSIADALEAKAQIATAANQSETGQWMRIALAAEKISNTSSTAAPTTDGYMLRAAKALEATGTTTGAEENHNYYGYLKRVVDALEGKSAATTGSLEHRAVTASLAAIFSAYANYALALPFKTASTDGYWVGGTKYATPNLLPGYTFTRSGAIRQEVEAVTNNSLYGPELVTNGTGDSTAGWVNSSTQSFTSVGGRLRVASTGTSATAYQDIFGLTVGQRYRLKASMFPSETNFARVQVTGALAQTFLYATSPTIDTEFVAATTSVRIGIEHANAGAWGTLGQYAEFDNISLTTSNLYQYEGAELVTNGTFDTDLTGWTAVGTATQTMVANKIRVTAGATAGGSSEQTFPIIAGKVYEVRVVGTPGTGGRARVTVSGSGYTLINQNVNGQFVSRFTAPATFTATISLFPSSTGVHGVAGDFADFDNIGIKEIVTDALDDFPTNVPAIVPGVGLWSRGALTNELPYSQDFSNNRTLSGFLSFGSGSTVNAAVAPDGTTTMDYIRENAAAGRHYLHNNSNPSNAATKTYSFFAKAGERTKGRIAVGSGSAANVIYADFDLVAGTITAHASTGTPPATGVQSAILNYGGGIYRLVLVVTTIAALHAGYIIMRDAAGLEGYTGDGVSGFYVWHEQMIDGNHPDGGPIIATGAATASTGADALSTNSNPYTVDQDFILWCVVDKKGVAETADSLALNLGGNIRFGWSNAQTSRSFLNNAQDVTGVTMGVGRQVFLYRRRAGKDSMHFKNTAGTIVQGAEVVRAWATTNSTITYGSGTTQSHVQEGVFAKTGTFSDADITAILGAA